MEELDNLSKSVIDLIQAGNWTKRKLSVTNYWSNIRMMLMGSTDWQLPMKPRDRIGWPQSTTERRQLSCVQGQDLTTKPLSGL